MRIKMALYCCSIFFSQVLNIFPYSLIALYGDTIIDLINTYSWKFKKMLIKMNTLVSPSPLTGNYPLRTCF